MSGLLLGLLLLLLLLLYIRLMHGSWIIQSLWPEHFRQNNTTDTKFEICWNSEFPHLETSSLSTGTSGGRVAIFPSPD